MAILSTTVASITDAQNFTLAGGSTLDNAYDSYAVQITNQSNTAQFVFAIIGTYVGSSRLVTLFEDPGYAWTLAVGDPVDILAALNKRRRVSQLPALTPTLNTEIVGLEAGVVGRGLVDTIFGLIPAATTGQDGKVTTAAQSFAGAKTFTGLVDGSAQTAAAANNFITRALGDARWAQLANGYSFMKETLILVSDPSWTFDPLTRFALVTVQGGGGGGGGGSSTGATYAGSGTGGGAGGHAWKWIDVSALSNRTANIVIGAGGAGSTGGFTGSNGGTSSFTIAADSIAIVCPGGKGGGGGTGTVAQGFNPNTANSDTPTGGDYNFKGASGGGRMEQGANIDITMNALGGTGGASVYGPGGVGASVRATGALGANGNNGSGRGSGGGGGASVGNAGGKTGGDGNVGLVIIREFT